MLGLDWRALTLRELEIGWQGRALHDWDQTSEIVAKIHNSNCAKTSDLKTASHFHPFRDARANTAKLDAGSIRVLEHFAREQ